MLSGLCMHNYVLLGVLVCGLAGLLAVVGYSTPSSVGTTSAVHAQRGR